MERHEVRSKQRKEWQDNVSMSREVLTKLTERPFYDYDERCYHGSKYYRIAGIECFMEE